MTAPTAPKPADGGPATGGTLRLPHDARASRQVRRELRADLGRRGVPAEVIDDAEIVVSELFGNAVRHARPVEDSILVRWEVRGSMVEVEVTDGGGPTITRRRDLQAMATGGHGLNIVAAVSRSWGIVDAGHLRTVWAAIMAPVEGTARIAARSDRLA